MNKKEQRYILVSNWINDQTEQNWKKLESFIISNLDFETRLEMSKDQELF